MQLDSLADRDATINPRLVVRHVKDKQVLFVGKHCSDVQRTLFTELAVGEMQVGQSFIGSNPLREYSRALATNIAVVENQLGQEAFV